LRRNSHKRSTASASESSGKTFFAHAAEGVAIIDHRKKLPIVSFVCSFVASREVLVKRRNLSASTPVKASGSDDRTCKYTAPLSSCSLNFATRHSGKLSKISSAPRKYVVRELWSSSQSILTSPAPTSYAASCTIRPKIASSTAHEIITSCPFCTFPPERTNNSAYFFNLFLSIRNSF
jgi:hypothetical protein